MSYDKLTAAQKEKLASANSRDEMETIADREGLELSDELLADLGIAGGYISYYLPEHHELEHKSGIIC